MQDAARSRVDDGENDRGDNQAGYRVGKGEAKGNADQSDECRQRREAINARVLPIGDKWNAIDAFPH